MSVDVADWGLLLTVLELGDGADVPTTGQAVAEALGISADYADVIERRLEHGRERGLLDRDRRGNWRPTPAGLAAASRFIRPGPLPA